MEPENLNIEETQEEVEVIEERSVLNKVTPLSKYLAMVLFIVLPFIGGWVGYTYAPEKVVEVQKVIEIQKEVIREIERDAINNVTEKETEQDVYSEYVSDILDKLSKMGPEEHYDVLPHTFDWREENEPTDEWPQTISSIEGYSLEFVFTNHETQNSFESQVSEDFEFKYFYEQSLVNDAAGPGSGQFGYKSTNNSIVCLLEYSQIPNYTTKISCGSI